MEVLLEKASSQCNKAQSQNKHALNAVAIYLDLWPPCELFKVLILQLAQLMVFLDNIKKVMKIKLENETFFSPQKALIYCSLRLEIEE